ncbi:hypothetical protein ACQP2P_36855 [Dactylosporangium sp. CA-139114]|uniref:hypothetical protein n=1 Tax=Dactylosporangium sp. CA-139114 TaxID=3239931 RepID=UPI003D956C2F
MRLQFGGARLTVNPSQALGVPLLEPPPPRLGEGGPDRGATGAAEPVLGQHRLQPVAPFQRVLCGQRVPHADNLEQGYDKKSGQ